MAIGLWGVSFIYVFMQMMRLESQARKGVGLFIVLVWTICSYCFDRCIFYLDESGKISRGEINY